MTVSIMPMDIPGRSNMYRVIVARNEWRGSKCIKSAIDIDCTMSDLTYCQPGTQAHAMALANLALQVWYGKMYPTPPASDSSTYPYSSVASDTPTTKM